MEPRYALLSKAVRDAVDRVSPADVASDPGVIAAREKVEHLRGRVAAASAQIVTRRDALAASEAELASTASEIAAIDSARDVLAQRAALGEDCDGEDRSAHQRRKDLERRKALLARGLELASPWILSEVNTFGRACEDAESELQEAAWQARVARAETLVHRGERNGSDVRA